jgi:nucleoside-diphosphate-sugar epimerase
MAGGGGVNRLLAFGFGYSAKEIARLLQAGSWRVSGTARSADSLAEMERQGVEPILFDGASANSELDAAIARATHLLVSIPPGPDGDPALRLCGEAIAKAPALVWIGYLSTIGVYGDHGGGWVDEATPVTPLSQRSRERAEAEAAWAAFAGRLGVAFDIFRLAGIYGPGRSPLDRLRNGKARIIVKPGQVFNRIHVADIAQTVMKAIARPSPTPQARIFNVADDEPAPPQEVMAFAARLLGMEPPPFIPFEQAGLTEMGRSFYEESKRARNDAIKRDLGVTLLYPTYREGFRSLAALL